MRPHYKAGDRRAGVCRPRTPSVRHTALLVASVGAGILTHDRRGSLRSGGTPTPHPTPPYPPRGVYHDIPRSRNAGLTRLSRTGIFALNRESQDGAGTVPVETKINSGTASRFVPLPKSCDTIGRFVTQDSGVRA